VLCSSLLTVALALLAAYLLSLVSSILDLALVGIVVVLLLAEKVMREEL